MSFNSSRDSRIAVGSTALASYLSGISQQMTVDTSDATTLTDVSKTYVPGLTESQVSCSGFFEPLFHTPALAAFGAAVSQPVTIAKAGFSAGSPVVVLTARAVTYEVSAAVGEVVGASVAFQGDGRFDVGVSLADLAEVTANGNGGAQAADAATSNGGIATLHVPACAGTLTVKVQGSANGTSGWTDLATFTAATGATSERVVVAGAVSKYLRASWTLTGASAAATFTCSFARR